MHVSIHECVHTCMRVCMHVCRRGIQVHTESREMENMRRRNKNGSVSHGGERQRAASGGRASEGGNWPASESGKR